MVPLLTFFPTMETSSDQRDLRTSEDFKALTVLVKEVFITIATRMMNIDMGHKIMMMSSAGEIFLIVGQMIRGQNRSKIIIVEKVHEVIQDHVIGLSKRLPLLWPMILILMLLILKLMFRVKFWF